MEICKSHKECFEKVCSLCEDYEPLSSHAVLADVRAVTDEIRKRIIEDKVKLIKYNNPNTQISGHIKCELIVREVIRDYEKGEHFS